VAEPASSREVEHPGGRASIGGPNGLPYWRLSSFYFSYFAALGVLVPYWGLYLQHLGFSPLQIGELLAVLMATKVVAPNVWGWIADRTGRRMGIVRLASLLSVLVYLPVFGVDGFWGLALAMSLFSFFWNASLPLFEAVTCSHLGQAVGRYSQVRLWGSVGFIVAVSGLGVALDRAGPAVIPFAVLAFFLAIWLSSLLVRERGQCGQVQEGVGLRSLLRRRDIRAFLAACLLAQAAHGTYYAFFSIYMERTGYSSTLIGQLWSLGVAAEILMFLVMHRLLARFSARDVLLVSLLLSVLRWLLIGFFPANLGVIMGAQTLHAATFGTFHAAAIHLVHRFFTGKVQGRGQALYSSLSFGAGGALGTLCSGALWESVGPELTFAMSALVALAAYLVAWRWGVRDGP